MGGDNSSLGDFDGVRFLHLHCLLWVVMVAVIGFLPIRSGMVWCVMVAVIGGMWVSASGDNHLVNYWCV